MASARRDVIARSSLRLKSGKSRSSRSLFAEICRARRRGHKDFAISWPDCNLCSKLKNTDKFELLIDR
eukprot:6177709-Pleurochrysis_carterae.AAC.1